MRVHCCKQMRDDLDHVCQAHPNRFECPDAIIAYDQTTDEYGIIAHNEGSPLVTVIYFCPWCGTKLPDSLIRPH